MAPPAMGRIGDHLDATTLAVTGIDAMGQPVDAVVDLWYFGRANSISSCR